jgi:FkbM family methyltransferase
VAFGSVCADTSLTRRLDAIVGFDYMPSQCGQDLFVLDVLEAKCNGFFLDSGASDGIRASNTQLLETSFGWKGICVEPNERAFAALVKNRRCRCVNCCLYDRDGTVEFLEDANILGGILDEYHPTHLEYARKTFRVSDASGQPITVRKPARAVRSVLRECGAPPVIDYWSLDTEGSELAILKSFPFDEYAFRVLTVEHNWLPVREEIRALLESHGYRRIKALAMDDCYVKRGNTHRSSWRSSAWTRASNRRR